MKRPLKPGDAYYSEKNQRKIAQEYESFLYDKAAMAQIAQKLEKIVGDNKHGDDLYKFVYYGLSRRLSLLERCVINIFSKNPFDTGTVPSEDVRTDVVLYIHCFYIHLYGALENLARIYAIKTDYKSDGVFDLSFFYKKRKNTSLLDTLPIDVKNKFIGDGKWLEYVKNTRDLLVHQEPGYLPPYYIKIGDDSEWQRLENLKRSEQIEYLKDLAETNKRTGVFSPDTTEIIERITKQRTLEQNHNKKIDLLNKEQEKYQMFIPTFVTATDGKRPAILYHPQLLVDMKTLYEKINLILDYIIHRYNI